MLPNYKTVDSQVQFNGKRCMVRTDTVQVTNTDLQSAICNVSTHKFEVVQVKDVIAVVLIDADTGKIVLNENTRYPVGERFLELIAGQIEPGQSPEDACIAEVKQESGYDIVPDTIENIGTFFTSPGLLTEKCTIFVAHGRPAGDKSLEEMEDLENKHLTLEEVATAMNNNEIRDLKTVFGIVLMIMDRMSDQEDEADVSAGA